MHWNEETGTPASIVSGKTKPYPGAPREMARSFLKANHRLFGMKPDLSDLAPAEVRRNRGVRHVRFQQTYRGLPVYEADYLVHLKKGGRVSMANGTYYPQIQVPTTPQVSKAAAQRIALGNLKGKPQQNQITSELMIYPAKERFHLAWQLTVPIAPFGGWSYFIDARSGAILAKGRLLMDVTGDGKVYPEHPGISSVNVKDLYRLDGSGYLRGTYTNVVNDETSRAQSSSLSFQYGTSNTHFDEANLYYHVDRFRKQFVNDLTDSNHPLNFTQITAHAHSTHPHPAIEDRNAWFDRGNQEIYFGDASSSPDLDDFAREDKVIYHEYMHAVTYVINSNIADPPSVCKEEGAISEGTADYFAGAFTGRAEIGNYVGFIRDMETPDIGSYSDYQSKEDDYPACPNGIGVEPHDGGEFWSSALWNMHNLSGIDQLIYDVLFYMDSSPTFLEFRDALFDAAESDGRSPSYVGEICMAFHGRGIGGNCTPEPQITSGPLHVVEGESNTWTAYASGGSGSYDYGWQKRRRSGAPWDPTCFGATTSCTATFSEDEDDFNDDGGIRVIVTDLKYGTFDISTRPLTIGDDDGGGGGCNDLTGDQICQSNLPTDLAMGQIALPEEFALEGSYPNPVQAGQLLTIPFALPEAATVTLTVYDLLGRQVRRIESGTVGAGYPRAIVGTEDLAGGVYVYRLRAGDYTGTGKFVVVK